MLPSATKLITSGLSTLSGFCIYQYIYLSIDSDLTADIYTESWETFPVSAGASTGIYFTARGGRGGGAKNHRKKEGGERGEKSFEI